MGGVVVAGRLPKLKWQREKGKFHPPQGCGHIPLTPVLLEPKTFFFLLSLHTGDLVKFPIRQETELRHGEVRGFPYL